jgi:hypothetical protein
MNGAEDIHAALDSRRAVVAVVVIGRRAGGGSA